jgi:hypothetical protein
MLIEELATARTFAQTHRAIALLNKAGDFTPAQLNAIVSAYVNNPQVHWIIDDADVRDFLLGLSDQISEVDEALLRELEATKNAASDSPLKRLSTEIALRAFLDQLAWARVIDECARPVFEHELLALK